MKTKPHDIWIRLDDKKYIKDDLQKIAKKNRITLTKLVVDILEDWLKERKAGKNFHLKLE